MKDLKIIFALIFFSISFSAFGQLETNDCDTVLDFAESLPQYEKGVKGLMDYFITDLTPIISSCYEQEADLIANIHLILIIDKQGKVVEVEFNRMQASEKCKEQLRGKLLNMSGWKPGKQFGKTVCSKYYWPISCINWE